LFILFLCVTATRADDAPKEIVLREGLVIPAVGRSGRSAVHTDAIEAMMVAGTWTAPKAGDTVKLPDGNTRAWETLKAGNDSTFSGRALAGGYAFFTVPSDSERVMILDAAGHRMVYVNGEPRGGDPYSTGYVKLPILLKKGMNKLLFSVSRGRLRAKLVLPKKAKLAPSVNVPAYFDLSDSTLPDLLAGQQMRTYASVGLVNTTNKTLEAEEHIIDGAILHGEGGNFKVTLRSVTLPPLSVRKVPIAIEGTVPVEEEKFAFKVSRNAGINAHVFDEASFTLRVRRPDQSHKRTFISDIDGSVQYYAVMPAKPLAGESEPPALFLTLHGASVEAMGQADAYAPKTWGHLVAPTNRRPYGFDWEDWGRLDALEVLEHAQKELKTDPRRTYLTGHSMGGHGAWHLGVTFPDRFAAVGPSAGWVSMFSYAGARKMDQGSPMTELLQRCMTPSDTLALVKNLAHDGVYVLHGDKDDNVPVAQARQMREELAKFHHDFQYFEQPGAGHWWGGGNEGCVDWPPMFDLFARHRLPTNEEVRQVDFITASPGISAWSHWAGIEAQKVQLKPSSISIRYNPGPHSFAGTTDNVARLALDLAHVPACDKIPVELDGQKLDVPRAAGVHRIWLARDGDKWAAIPQPSLALKGPHRYGPFKDAFRHKVQFVYGTKGNTDENAWALAKARYDAETFWYQGNASVDVLPDTAYDSAKENDRNVILYGNADTNAAWQPLLAASPVQVRRGQAKIGDKPAAADDLALLFLRPRPGSDQACVGVVTGTGIKGMRLTDRLPYFTSGVAYPDCILLSPAMLTSGTDGVRAAGFFGADWSVAKGEFVWKE
jgi:poly(3-hydroxybutyrate) depolymerase